ncbi:MAG: hypothetical protein KF774_09655 [Planctomyces sp.]|nr:hypothetical protein [Planctomyces sp.]
MAGNHQRSRYWVNSRIQGQIIGRIAFYWVLYHLVLWHLMFIVRYVGYQAARMTGEVEYRSIGEIYTQFARDFGMLVFCALLLAPIFIYDLTRQTHRIAGPLVRLQHSLRQLIAGEHVPSVRLRRGDLLTDFQDSFNQFLTFYAAKIAHDRAEGGSQAEQDAAVLEQINQLRSIIDQHPHAHPAPSPVEAGQPIA